MQPLISRIFIINLILGVISGIGKGYRYGAKNVEAPSHYH